MRRVGASVAVGLMVLSVALITTGVAQADDPDGTSAGIYPTLEECDQVGSTFNGQHWDHHECVPAPGGFELLLYGP